MTSPAAEPEKPSLQAFRRAYADLNTPAPARRVELDPETTGQIHDLVNQVRAMCEHADAAAQAAAKAAADTAKRPARPAPPRRPLAWSAAMVLITVTVCVLLAWLGWLFFTTGSAP